MFFALSCTSNKEEKSIAEQNLEKALEGIDVSPYMKQYHIESSNALEDVSMAIKSFNMSQSEKDYQNLLNLYYTLHFEFDDYGYEEMPREAKKFFQEHKYKVDSVRMVAKKILDGRLPNSEA